MLPLPTFATIEAMDVSTDRRYPFHTYNDDNLFRQFGITTKKQNKNIVISTDNVDSDIEISNAKGSLRQ